MTTVDFTAWAVPDLVLPLGGRTYTVHPPSVAQARILLALCVRSEVALGLHPGPVPQELEDVLQELDATGVTLGETVLGEVNGQLRDDGVTPLTIDRMAYYALHYWARGKQRADAIATALWSQPEEDSSEGDALGESVGR